MTGAESMSSLRVLYTMRSIAAFDANRPAPALLPECSDLQARFAALSSEACPVGGVSYKWSCEGQTMLGPARGCLMQLDNVPTLPASGEPTGGDGSGNGSGGGGSGKPTKPSPKKRAAEKRKASAALDEDLSGRGSPMAHQTSGVSYASASGPAGFPSGQGGALLPTPPAQTESRPPASPSGPNPPPATELPKTVEDYISHPDFASSLRPYGVNPVTYAAQIRYMGMRLLRRDGMLSRFEPVALSGSIGERHFRTLRDLFPDWAFELGSRCYACGESHRDELRNRSCMRMTGRVDAP